MMRLRILVGKLGMLVFAMQLVGTALEAETCPTPTGATRWQRWEGCLSAQGNFGSRGAYADVELKVTFTKPLQSAIVV